LNKKSERFDQEIKELQSRAEAEAEKNTKLCESMKDLRNKCTDFATRCVNRLKGIFNSVGATSEEIAPSAFNNKIVRDNIKGEKNYFSFIYVCVMHLFTIICEHYI
jgi:hypothetical protein